MASLQQIRSRSGATHLRPGDIIVTLVLLGLLLFAAWKQFPTYGSNSHGQSSGSTSAHQP
jgi:hypothetical protein